MPRDQVDVRNIVLSKRVPRVALRLLDPLNRSDAANAARLCTTTEQSPDAIDQGQTATQDPLSEPALPLKRQAHTNEIDDDHGKQFPGLCLHWLFTHRIFQPQNGHVQLHLLPAPPLHNHLVPLRKLKMKMGLHPHQVQGIVIVISNSNRLTARRPQKQPTIIASDEENEDTRFTDTDDATRKGLSLGTCYIHLTGIQLELQ
jgi:hypothetical protein